MLTGFTEPMPLLVTTSLVAFYRHHRTDLFPCRLLNLSSLRFFSNLRLSHGFVGQYEQASETTGSLRANVFRVELLQSFCPAHLEIEVILKSR